jgi:ORF6N domain
VIRGQKVMLDSDLAALYKVPTKSLNLAVRRNRTRFPVDFMFQLNAEEVDRLRLQFETSKAGRGDDGIYRTPSPRRVWRCCPLCCAASEPFR